MSHSTGHFCFSLPVFGWKRQTAANATPQKMLAFGIRKVGELNPEKIWSLMSCPCIRGTGPSRMLPDLHLFDFTDKHC